MVHITNIYYIYISSNLSSQPLISISTALLSEYNCFVAMLLGYLIYDWGETMHGTLQRKDPKEFENDQ